MFSAAPWTAVLALLVIEVVVVVSVRMGLTARHLLAARHRRSGGRDGLQVPRSASV